MRYAPAVMILLAGCTWVIEARETSIVPYGSPPMLNGNEGDREWPRSGVLEWESEPVSVRMKQDSHYVYLCVADQDTTHTGIDLYVDNLAGEILMLHVSSAHGERRKHDTGWTEISYGPPESWSSNVVESVFDGRQTQFIAPDVFEFQIDKSCLPRPTFRLMVHLKRPERWVPAVVDTLSSDDWVEVGLR